MRPIETVDNELRLLAAARWSLGDNDGAGATREEIDEIIDALLGERLRLAQQRDERSSAAARGDRHHSDLQNRTTTERRPAWERSRRVPPRSGVWSGQRRTPGPTIVPPSRRSIPALDVSGSEAGLVRRNTERPRRDYDESENPPSTTHVVNPRLFDWLSAAAGVSDAHWQLIAQAAVPPGATVLDIGAGTGNLLLKVKRAVPDATVVGLDSDTASLAVAAAKASRLAADVQLDHGDATHLTYPDATFDRVVSAFLLHHLPDD